MVPSDACTTWRLDCGPFVSPSRSGVMCSKPEGEEQAALETTADDLPRTDKPFDAVTMSASRSLLGALRDILDEPPEIQLRSEEAEDAAISLHSQMKGKYRRAATIGSGGMGMVIKAFDVDLRRWVAMKVVRQGAAHNKVHLSRFVEEAQVCGQLEHPNIPPVHELGLDHDGQVYFTMKLVKGRTLGEIARNLAEGDSAARREFTPIRIAQILQQAAMGVHYANVRGVIHRDLKPDNIMLGDYGEVLVVDWGLAKVMGEGPKAPVLDGAEVVTDRRESGYVTLAGSVQGSPAYMAPEQARGDLEAIDARTDVFGLGAVLYNLLCYRPPYADPTLDKVLESARSGAPPPPAKLAPEGVVIPPDLEAICMKALSKHKKDRHADAGEFGRDLQSYIDGTRDRERKRSEALALVEEGRKHIASYRDLEEKREELKADVKRIAQKIAPHDPVEQKKPLWAAEQSVEHVQLEAADRFSDAKAVLDAAIQTDPGCPEARRALADLYWTRFEQAEAQRDAQDVAFYRRLVEANDDGHYASQLKGDGALSVTADPDGTEAILYRFVEEDRVLVPRERKHLGKTPLGPVPIPMGSYLLVLKREGYRDTRYPILIRRSENHSAQVKLFTDEEIGKNFVYVPAGEFLYGGDPESGGFERSRPFVENFFIARLPVTMGEYCEFLNALHERGEDVKEHVARQTEEVFIELGENGRFQPRRGMAAGDIGKRYPPGFEVTMPVFAVNWDSAVAYARWRSEVDGRDYSLPPEEAWEKAARGVDGRFFPWGDHFDWTFAKGGMSRAELAQPEPIGIFSADESPYGVRDLAGTIREWTADWFDERGGTKALRGGSWNLVLPRHFRCATRFGYLPMIRSSVLGFRLFTKQPLPAQRR